MDAHLYAEGIDSEVEDDYWLSQKNVDNWKEINDRVEKGVIGTKEIYRKEILEDGRVLNYSIALNFFEHLDPQGAEVPEGRIEETEENLYLMTEGVRKGNKISRDQAYDFASLMTLIGDIEWTLGNNVRFRKKPVLIDLEYVGEYLITNEESFRENLLEPWFTDRGYSFDEEEFNQRMEKQAKNMPDSKEIRNILEEKIDARTEKNKQNTLKKIEEAFETAKKGEISIKYIAEEISEYQSLINNSVE